MSGLAERTRHNTSVSSRVSVCRKSGSLNFKSYWVWLEPSLFAQANLFHSLAFKHSKTIFTFSPLRGNNVRAMELYNSAITFARSETEMAQAYISREVVTAQNQACSEYNISPADLASRAMY